MFMSTCYTQNSTGATNNINDGLIPLNRPSMTTSQRAQYQKLEHLNGLLPWLLV